MAFYTSSNGDRWYLLYHSNERQRAFIRHVPNESSGGKASDIELVDFLSRPGDPPEKQALMRVIAAQAQPEEETVGRPPKGGQGPHSPTD
jgi:hypothetical protein